MVIIMEDDCEDCDECVQPKLEQETIKIFDYGEDELLMIAMRLWS